MRNQLKTVALFGVLTSCLVGLGVWMGGPAPALFLILALVLNAGAYFFSDRLVLKMHGAVELSVEEAPALHRMLQELSESAGIPKPRLYRIPEATPNAFATGRNPAHGVVAVTDGLRALLSERELRGVLAHELAHIQNRDILIASMASVMASVIGYLAQTIQWAFLLGSSEEEEEGGASGLLVAFVAPLLATLLQLAISRSREFLADEAAARMTGDPEALALALERLEGWQVPMQAGTTATASLFIVNPFAGLERVASWFSTHPATVERIHRLRAMPSLRWSA